MKVLTLSILTATVFLLSCTWRADSSTQRRSSSSSTPARVTSPVLAASSGTTDADYTRYVNELKTRIKDKLKSSEFSIIIQRPFVVVGDEAEATVRQRSEDTVKWAVDRLKQDFFSKDPNEILEVWLFKDEVSYRKNAQLMFGDNPSTPYGYYSTAHKALIMNIGTGGGTLVHEIVHPFVEANFPSCPSWLNEGLGSLYEQCGEVDGHIHGYTNWRLPGLQTAIKENRVPTFKTLMEMDSRAFYNDDRGVNYAQARYLCYYLQQKGLLVKFYQEFVRNQSNDPSGYKTLRRILREPNMEAFQARWGKYVLGLRQGYDVTVQ